MPNKKNRKIKSKRLENRKIRCQVIIDDHLESPAIRKTAEFIARDTSIYYLLESNSHLALHDAIKRLNRTQNQNGRIVDMYGVNFARNIKFPPGTVMLANRRKYLYRNIPNVAVLLHKLEFDKRGRLASGQVLVLDIDLKEERACLLAQKLTINILQQFIYLGLCVPVMTKKEFIASSRADRLSFRGNQEKDDPVLMNITVIGTKKAGKSALVNSLLGAGYAVVNSELPTPNRIVYRWNDKGDDIIMRYAGKTSRFGGISALREYMRNESLKANNNAIALPEMQIDTPLIKETMRQFAVIDTPGSNYAVAKDHTLVAYNAIKSSDICIFVLNYSNHLTDDEVKFFSYVYQAFFAEKRLYSLIVVINRIDERYASDDTSDDRVIDYIKTRLEALGFKDFLVLGASSLLYFYLNEVKNIADKNHRLLTKNYLRELKEEHRKDVKVSTYLSFIKKYVGNLEDFHENDVRDMKLLYQASGIPLLLEYILCIAQLRKSLQVADGKTKTV